MPTKITIKIILLMDQLQSSTLVKRKLSTDFDQSTIRQTFQRFCESGTVEDRQRPARPITNYRRKHWRTYWKWSTIDHSIYLLHSTNNSTSNYQWISVIETVEVQELNEEDMQDRIHNCQTLIPIFEHNQIQQNFFFSNFWFKWISQ